jgi:hypothetical protein
MIDGRLIVVVRTCESKTVREGSTRPYGMSKAEVSRACVQSLWNSAAMGHFPRPELHVIDDSSSEEFRQWVEKLEYVNNARPAVRRFDGLDGDNSYAEALKLLESLGPDDRDYVYLSEDDYFYAPDAFWHLRDFWDIYSGHYFLNLHQQHLWFTRTMQVRQSGTLWGYDIAGADICEAANGLPVRSALLTHGHWWLQQLNTSTLTFGARMGTIRKHWVTLWQARKGSNDDLVAQLYKIDPCYTPIPGLASHLQEGCQTPFFTDGLAERQIRGGA